jgi:hypothetical protein
MLGSELEVVLDLVDTLPEMGTTMARACKEIRRIRILGLDDFGPDGVILVVQLPNPFEEQRNVHFPCIEEAQAPHGLGPAHRGPVNQVILALCPCTFPEELGAMRVEAGVYPLVEKK